MHPDLHRYLDGEIPRERLPAELAAEAAEWDALLGSASLMQAERRAPPWLEERIMSAIRTAPRPGRKQRILRWIFEPRTVRLRPITLLVVSGVAALVLFVWPRGEPPVVPAPVTAAAPRSAPPARAGEEMIYVQFVFAGADARSVALAGDFNGWDTQRNPLRDPDGDGIWTGTFAIPPGLHKYMFVVDGDRWVTDPRAERYVDDGFGMRNALITVTAPRRRSS
ncbi:MAG TPA: isoamylase early set domain-containing protein [Longimicrobiales bacterium]